MHCMLRSRIGKLRSASRPAPPKFCRCARLRWVWSTCVQLRVEAHLLEFSGDLYEQELELIFLEKLRDEKKFGSRQELSEQITRDIRDARSRF